MWKGLFKGSSVANVKNRHLKDAQNAKVFGIALVSVKSLIGLTTNKSAIKNANNLNNCKRKLKMLRKSLNPNLT